MKMTKLENSELGFVSNFELCERIRNMVMPRSESTEERKVGRNVGR